MVLNQKITPAGKVIKGKRSWFFSDDRVLCLGSGIACDVTEHPTQTTLCQKSLRNTEPRELLPTSVDGADVVAFPAERTLEPAKPHWFSMSNRPVTTCPPDRRSGSRGSISRAAMSTTGRTPKETS